MPKEYIVAALLCILVNVKGQDTITTGCGIRGIDLVFVIDGSRSIRTQRFPLIRKITAQIAGSLNIGSDDSRVGAIIFDADSRIHFNLLKHTDRTTLLPALNPGLPYDRDNIAVGTDTAGALNLLLDSAQDGNLGIRSDRPHVAIVLTDGRATNPQAVLTNAINRLHAAGLFQVYAIGVGGNVDESELNEIASGPSFVFRDSFDSTGIQRLQQGISQRLCEENPPTVMGDPHFMVPLMSGYRLCYSIQGYPGLVFNLIYNHNYIINALFVDSNGDEEDATWIGKLAVIPQHSNKSEAVIFDSVNQKVILVNQGHFTAAAVDTVAFDEMGKMSVKFTRGVTKQTGNPLVRVEYAKPFATFDVSFYGHHLNVDWSMKYDNVPQMHGLMGQFMVKGLSVDPIKKMLTYPDSHDPVAVELDDVMTGKTCWKAINPGHQGEGLIEGDVLDYMVSTLLEDDFKLKKI